MKYRIKQRISCSPERTIELIEIVKAKLNDNLFKENYISEDSNGLIKVKKVVANQNNRADLFKSVFKFSSAIITVKRNKQFLELVIKYASLNWILASIGGGLITGFALLAGVNRGLLFHVFFLLVMVFILLIFSYSYNKSLAKSMLRNSLDSAFNTFMN